MIEKWLERYLNKQHKNNQRTQLGLFSGKAGLFSNLVLFLIKMSAGVISGSVSIIGDAINSLADCASSILTLFGFHIAAKPADKQHPYGHERSEYITGLVVSLGILFVGFQFLLNSIQRMIDPAALNTTPLVLILLILSIIIKLVQGYFYRKVGKKIRSNAIDAAAQDSFNDVYTTLVVLGASLVEIIFGWQIDGYAGVFIALYILYNGVSIIRESIDDLLGKGPTEKQIREIKHFLDHYPSIVGYHDLLMHHYGPNKTFATIHIEIDDSWSLMEAHRIIDDIEKDFKEYLGVDLVCHLDPIAIKSKEQTIIYQQVKRILQSYELNLKFHDFRVEEMGGLSTIQFDIVVPDNIEQTNQELLEAIKRDIAEIIGTFEVEIEFDRIYLLKE